MNYYIGKLQELFTNEIPGTFLLPTGTSIYNFTVKHKFALNTGLYNTWHDVDFNYGVFVENDVDPEPLNY